jgi:hypothetical protein
MPARQVERFITRATRGRFPTPQFIVSFVT